MSYHLLFSLVISVCFAISLQEIAEKNRGKHLYFVIAGMLSLSIGLGSEISLAYAFSDEAIKSYYIFRLALPLVWIGIGLVLQFSDLQLLQRETTILLLILSIGFTTLVLTTPITEASSWFDSQTSLEVQYPFILATNRITRGLLWLFSAFGLTTSFVVSIKCGINQMKSKNMLWGTLSLLFPLGISFISWATVGPMLKFNYYSNLIPALGVSLIAVGFYSFIEASRFHENLFSPVKFIKVLSNRIIITRDKKH